MDVIFASKVKTRCLKYHDKEENDGVVKRTDELMSQVNAIMGYLSLVDSQSGDLLEELPRLRSQKKKGPE